MFEFIITFLPQISFFSLNTIIYISLLLFLRAKVQLERRGKGDTVKVTQCYKRANNLIIKK